jgi:hypothetical protein
MRKFPAKIVEQKIPGSAAAGGAEHFPAQAPTMTQLTRQE